MAAAIQRVEKHYQTERKTRIRGGKIRKPMRTTTALLQYAGIIPFFFEITKRLLSSSGGLSNPFKVHDTRLKPKPGQGGQREQDCEDHASTILHMAADLMRRDIPPQRDDQLEVQDTCHEYLCGTIATTMLPGRSRNAASTSNISSAMQIILVRLAKAS